MTHDNKIFGELKQNLKQKGGSKMSFETWSDEGYGIKMSNLKIRDMDSVWNLINLDNNLSAYLGDHLAQYDDSDKAVNDMELITSETEWYSEDYRLGIAGILSIVIEAKENINVSALTDYDGEEYLILLPHYSWARISDREKNITKNELENILRKYISIVSDSPVKFDYQTVENCG